MAVDPGGSDRGSRRAVLAAAGADLRGVAQAHTFAELADAIDTAFARWDRSHLTLFELSDGSRVYGPIEWDEAPESGVYGAELRLSRLTAGEQLAYTFDMGDDWTHLCTVAAERIDPLNQLGIVPAVPLPYWGSGQIPDQYGRRFDADDGETPLPPNPDATDLPAIHPYWGPRPPCPPR